MGNLQKTVLVFYTVGVLFSLVYGENLINERAGTVGALVMDIGIGAKAASLGEAYTAGYGNADMYFWNVGALGLAPRLLVSFSHMEWLLSSKLEHISVAFPLSIYPYGNFGVIGINAEQLDYGTQKRTFENTDGTFLKEEGTFTMKDVLFGIHYGYEISSFSVGIGANILNSNYDNVTATGFAMNFGLLYKTPVEDLAVGICARNIGGSIKYIEEDVPLPFTTRLGVSYAMLDRTVKLYSDFKISNYQFPSFHVGAEASVFSFLSLRAGYKYVFGGNPLGWLSGFSAGIGLFFDSIGYGLGNASIDYAFVPYGDLGTTHRITFEMGFGESKDNVLEDYYKKAEAFYVTDKESAMQYYEKIRTMKAGYKDVEKKIAKLKVEKLFDQAMKSYKESVDDPTKLQQTVDMLFEILNLDPENNEATQMILKVKQEKNEKAKTYLRKAGEALSEVMASKTTGIDKSMAQFFEYISYADSLNPDLPEKEQIYNIAADYFDTVATRMHKAGDYLKSYSIYMEIKKHFSSYYWRNIDAKASELSVLVEDKTPPEIVVGRTIEGKKLIITGFAKDSSPLKGIIINKMIVETNGEKEFPFSYEMQMTDGDNEIKVVAQDIMGNKEAKTFNYIYESVAPVVEIISPKEGMEVRSVFNLIGGATDNNFIVALRINGETVPVDEGRELTFEKEMLYDTEGVYRIKVEAVDLCGNVGMKEIKVNVKPTVYEVPLKMKAEKEVVGNKIIIKGAVTDIFPIKKIIINSIEMETHGETEYPIYFEKLLKDGENEIVITVIDEVENSDTAVFKHFFDGTAPVIEVIEPVDESNVPSPFVLKLRITDAGTVKELKINGENASIAEGREVAFEKEISYDKSAAYEIKITAIDSYGNANTKTVKCGAGGQEAGQEPIEFKLEHDVAGKKLKINGVIRSVLPLKSVIINTMSLETNGETEYQVEYEKQLNEGDNEVMIVAEDKEGKLSSKTIKHFYESVPPVIEVMEPQDGAELQSPFKLKLKVTDNTTVKSVEINGEPQKTDRTGKAEIEKEMKYENTGEYEIKISVYDSSGNTISRSVKVRIADAKAGTAENSAGIAGTDNTPPEIEIIEPKGRTLFSKTFMLKLKITDDVSVDYLKINGSEEPIKKGKELEFEKEMKYDDYGEYKIEIESADSGRNSASRSIKVRIINK